MIRLLDILWLPPMAYAVLEEVEAKGRRYLIVYNAQTDELEFIGNPERKMNSCANCARRALRDQYVHNTFRRTDIRAWY